MAIRPIFIIRDDKEYPVTEKMIEFQWEPGFSKTQKQKSIHNLHEQFQKEYPNHQILEVSTASVDELGRSLSAFNLKIESTLLKKEYTVETIFQSSKVFVNGGPFLDIKFKTPIEAKKDVRLKQSGELIGFMYGQGEMWSLEPKTLFYDWVYMNALHLNKKFVDNLIEIKAFSDIEFNPKKSINCQAKSLAMYMSLMKQNILEDVLSSREAYEEYRKRICRI